MQKTKSMKTISAEDISKISENDIQSCSELFVKVFRDPPWNDKWNSVNDAYCFLNDIFISARFIGIKAVLNGKLIGCIFGNNKKWWSGDIFHLNEMFVDIQYQNKGVGTVMFDSLNTILRKNNIAKILLQTSKDVDAMKFYSAKGFRENQNMVTMFYDEK